MVGFNVNLDYDFQPVTKTAHHNPSLSLYCFFWTMLPTWPPRLAAFELYSLKILAFTGSVRHMQRVEAWLPLTQTQGSAR